MFAEVFAFIFAPFIVYPVVVKKGYAYPSGLARAISLAISPKLHARTMPLTARSKEMKLIEHFANDNDNGQQYMVVTGPNDVGKTCLIYSVAERRCGTIKLHVSPGESSDAIKYKSISAIAGITSTFDKPEIIAARASRLYRLLFRRRLLLLIQAGEVSAGKEHAELSEAVRTLTEYYQIRVIVDASPNTIPLALLPATRAVVRTLFYYYRILCLAGTQNQVYGSRNASRSPPTAKTLHRGNAV